MGLETATYINGLVTTNPTSSDPKSQGDDHLRLVKSTVKATFPNITGAVTPTHGDLNVLAGAATGGVAMTLSSLNTGQLAGLRNRIINGAMTIDQRNSGAAQTITAAGGNQYTVDRWFSSCSGANVTGQRVSGTGANAYNYRFTGAASVTNIYFQQRIESANMIDLVGSTVTFSVNLANSLLTTVSWVANYPNSTDNYGGGATAISSGSFTVNSTLTKYTASFSVPAGATTGLQIYFSVGAQTSGTWTIGNVQLELGSVATPFEQRPYGMELALCQRYLPALVSPSASGFNATTQTAYIATSFPVTARVAPTGVTMAVAGALYATSGANYSITSTTFIAAGTAGAFIQPAIATASLTATQPAFLYGGTYLFTGCEL